MSINTHRDDIDVIVDRILSNPDRADELKTALRQSLRGTAHRRVAARSPSRIGESARHESESFWDNVPV